MVVFGAEPVCHATQPPYHEEIKSHLHSQVRILYLQCHDFSSLSVLNLVNLSQASRSQCFLLYPFEIVAHLAPLVALVSDSDEIKGHLGSRVLELTQLQSVWLWHDAIQSPQVLTSFEVNPATISCKVVNLISRATMAPISCI